MFWPLSLVTGEDLPPLQLQDEVFKSIGQLFDCLLTEVHDRCKKNSPLAKRLNSSIAFFCYDLLSVIEPRQVFQLVLNVLCFFEILLSCVCSSKWIRYLSAGNINTVLNYCIRYTAQGCWKTLKNIYIGVWGIHDLNESVDTSLRFKRKFFACCGGKGIIALGCKLQI
jgi:hypothetical protein